MRDVGMVRANHSVYVATRKLVGIGFFPSSMWVPRMEPRLSGWTAGVFTH